MNYEYKSCINGLLQYKNMQYFTFLTMLAKLLSYSSVRTHKFLLSFINLSTVQVKFYRYRERNC